MNWSPSFRTWQVLRSFLQIATPPVRTAATLLCLFGFSALVPLRVEGQNDCDGSIQHDQNDPDAYKERDHDRCEGYYLQPRSNEVVDLTLVGFTASTKYSTHSALPIQIFWGAPPSAGRFALHARSTNPRWRYRMDTHKPAQLGNYQWPTDFVARHRIPETDLTIFASTQVPGLPRRVIVPLIVGQRNSTAPATHYCVTVVTPYPMETLRAELDWWDPARQSWIRGRVWPVTGDLGTLAQNCFPIVWTPHGVFGRVTYTATYAAVLGAAPQGSPLPIIFFRS